MSEMLQQFLVEGRDCLDSIAQNLLDLERGPNDAGLVGQLFRSVHTLKGNAGLFDCPEMSRVLHAAEDLMSEVRDGRLVFRQELADRLLDGADFVSLLFDELGAGSAGAAAHAAASFQLAESLRGLIRAAPDPTGAATALDPANAPRDAGSDRYPQHDSALPLEAVPEALRAAWRSAAAHGTPLHWLSYTPAADCFFKNEDPFHRARQTAGVQWLRVSAAAAWPPLAELDPYHCVLRFDLVSSAARAELENHFRYAAEQVEIVTLTASILQPIAPAAVFEPAVAPEATVAPGATAGRRVDEIRPAATLLKVDREKIDRLMNLIGELVVAKNGLPFLAGRAEASDGISELSREIKAQYAVISRVAEDLQDTILQVGMMPVSGIFQRFPRLVRDISRTLGKQVLLTLEGEDTEADKTMIEALADPLMHIVRNSLDHGIEAPEVRRAAGKPAEGRLLIRASQESGRVLIEISDDGRGIDPAVIKRKAFEAGIIDADRLERISDQDALNLVFAAGFSTAATISDLSGRGVGMDVVRNAVERAHGSVSLSSVAGQGTTLRLSLPLSMAVSSVMVIESNRQVFGVPMDMVIETMRVPRGSIRSLDHRQTTVLRNRILPLRCLNELMASAGPQVPNDRDEMATLVVQIHGESLGIVVDDFRGVRDIILKPLSGILSGLTGYCGSAVLGDGSVLLVLNPKELVAWQ